MGITGTLKAPSSYGDSSWGLSPEKNALGTVSPQRHWRCPLATWNTFRWPSATAGLPGHQILEVLLSLSPVLVWWVGVGQASSRSEEAGGMEMLLIIINLFI